MNDMRDILRLHREYLDELVKLRMLPYGQTMNYNPTGGKSSEAPGGKRPAGEARPDHEVFAEAWMRCRSVGEREQVVREMREALDGWKHSKALKVVKEETWAQLAKRIRDSGSGWAVDDVCQALKVSPTQVRKARTEGSLNPETGEEFKKAALPADERKRRVLHLVGSGWAAKTVAVELGVAYKTVLRDLDEAA